MVSYFVPCNIVVNILYWTDLLPKTNSVNKNVTYNMLIYHTILRNSDVYNVDKPRATFEQSMDDPALHLQDPFITYGKS